MCLCADMHTHTHTHTYTLLYTYRYACMCSVYFNQPRPDTTLGPGTGSGSGHSDWAIGRHLAVLQSGFRLFFLYFFFSFPYHRPYPLPLPTTCVGSIHARIYLFTRCHRIFNFSLANWKSSNATENTLPKAAASKWRLTDPKVFAVPDTETQRRRWRGEHGADRPCSICSSSKATDKSNNNCSRI